MGLRVLIAHPRVEWQRRDAVREVEAVVWGQSLEDGFVEGRRDVLVVGAVELHGGQASMMWAPWAAMVPTWTWWSSPCWRKTVEMAWPMALAVSRSKLIQ